MEELIFVILGIIGGIIWYFMFTDKKDSSLLPKSFTQKCRQFWDKCKVFFKK